MLFSLILQATTDVFTLRDFQTIDTTIQQDIELQRNIDGNFDVLTQPLSFFGSFNGNGNIIQNLKIAKPFVNQNGIFIGLFGNLCQNTVIKNLTLKNITIYLNSAGENSNLPIYASPLVASGDIHVENVNISNCTVQLDGTQQSRYVGGIVGYSQNNAKINATQIFGLKIVMSHVQGVSNQGFFVGGIVGCSNELQVNFTFVDVTFKTGVRSHVIQMGGVCGYSQKLQLNLVNIESSVNIKSIYGYYGGIAGAANEIKVEDVYSGQTITINSNLVQKGNAGQLFGLLQKITKLEKLVIHYENNVNTKVQLFKAKTGSIITWTPQDNSIYSYSQSNPVQDAIYVEQSWLGAMTMFSTLQLTLWKVIPLLNHQLPRIFISDDKCQKLQVSSVCDYYAVCQAGFNSQICGCTDGFKMLNGNCVQTNCPYIEGIECGTNGECLNIDDKFVCACTDSSCFSGDCASCHPTEDEACFIENNQIVCADTQCKQDWTGQFCSVCTGFSCSPEQLPICSTCQNKDGICFLQQESVNCTGVTTCKDGYTNMLQGCRECAENYQRLNGAPFCTVKNDDAVTNKSSTGLIIGLTVGILLLIIIVAVTASLIVLKKKKKDMTQNSKQMKQIKQNTITYLDSNDKQEVFSNSSSQKKQKLQPKTLQKLPTKDSHVHMLNPIRKTEGKKNVKRNVKPVGMQNYDELKNSEIGV